MIHLTHDIKYAVRSLRRSPGFTLFTMCTLALAIGANTAIFSFVDAILLKPLPYPHPDRIVRLSETRPNGGRTTVSAPNFLDWMQNNVFEYMAAEISGAVTLMGSNDPVPLRGSRVSAQYFEIFGVKAAMGRTFLAEEDQPGKEHVAILGHALWQSEFGSSPTIVGERILLDGESYLVVGVMPADSAFGRSPIQVWRPLVLQPASMARDYRLLQATYALLKPGKSIEQASMQMSAIGSELAKTYPDSNRGWGVAVDRLADAIVGPQLRASLLILMAAVGSILLIGCANLANVAMVRSISREREVAIRAALGAGSRRLVQQFVSESVVLAMGGGLLGIGVADAGLGWLQTLLPAGSIPGEVPVEIDTRVLVFALACSTVTGILFGLVPALRALGPDLTRPMKDAGRGSTSGVAGHRLRDTLVVAEIAVAFLLLTGSGLLIRSFFRLLAVDAGFETTNVMTMRLPVPGFPPGSSYSDSDQFLTYMRDVQASIAAVPGVRSAAIAAAVPLESDCCLYRPMMQVSSQSLVDRADRQGTFLKVVSASYFETVGTRLEQGRFLTEDDRRNAPRVIVINERMARRYFANENPIGRRVRIASILPGKTQYGPEVEWQIVGVIADEKTTGLTDERTEVVYSTYDQSPVYFTFYFVRAALDPLALEHALRQAVYRVNKEQAIADVRTLDQIKASSAIGSRFQAVLLTIFSLLALMLAAVGVYGVISYSVAVRTNELGIRAALGASSSGLVRLVLGSGLQLAALGVGIGLVGSLVLTRLLASSLYHVSPSDPYTLFLVAGVLVVVSLLACYLPARRAAKIDPIAALTLLSK